MPRVSNCAVFTCDSCGGHLVVGAGLLADALERDLRVDVLDNGACDQCRGTTWIVSVAYQETAVDFTNSALLLAQGKIGVSTSTDSNVMSYRDVPGVIVVKLVDESLSKIEEGIRLLGRIRFKQQGGRECTECGFMFMPGAGKTWNERGYCSKDCLVAAEGQGALEPALEEIEPTVDAVAKHRVSCSAGHEFEVPKSFSGMRRPCPICGEKTQIP